MSRRIFVPVAIAGIVTAMKAAAQTSVGVRIYDRSSGGLQLTDIATVASGDNPGENYPNGVIQVGIDGLIPNFVGPDEISTVYFDYPGMVSRASLAADRAVTQGDGSGGGSFSQATADTLYAPITETAARVAADALLAPKSGATHTGTHDFTGATVTVATATAGDNDTSPASTAFVTVAVSAAPASLLYLAANYR